LIVCCPSRVHVLGRDNKIVTFAGFFYGSDETRTRDIRRDRPDVFFGKPSNGFPTGI